AHALTRSRAHALTRSRAHALTRSPQAVNFSARLYSFHSLYGAVRPPASAARGGNIDFNGRKRTQSTQRKIFVFLAFFCGHEQRDKGKAWLKKY
ncbi:MAG: hypothetical protein LBK71_04505, partial [Verrucomicrobiales bacterium]|nr:hypothetical protein [Verrucomicrobiales bacterium]